jgi:hypothetical protein
MLDVNESLTMKIITRKVNNIGIEYSKK